MLTPRTRGVTAWLVRLTFQALKLSVVAGDWGVGRLVVMTRAASYWTAISRMAVQSSTVRARETQVMTS